jgi:hypothetical protein
MKFAQRPLFIEDQLILRQMINEAGPRQVLTSIAQHLHGLILNYERADRIRDMLYIVGHQAQAEEVR